MKNCVELILESLLREDVMQPNVIDSIKKRYEVEVNYKADEDPKGSGYRVIQPVAYGKSKAGNLVLRAFQPFGDTKTKVPHWKLFRLDRIQSWKPLKNRKFTEPPNSQYNAEGKYNENGDKSMSEIYVIANFKGMRNDALMKYNQKRDKEKEKTNPYYRLQRNINKSIDGNKIDYIQKNVNNWQNSGAAKEFKGNSSSVYDMSKIKDFGDKETTQSVGPIKKGNIDINNNQTETELNYQTANNNGPLYK